jgi:hypothetical protein
MGELTGRQIGAALRRGQVVRAAEPRAAAARFDRRLRRVVVELTNGCSFAFPPRLVGGLEGASDAELASVEIFGAGYGLHWEATDVDVTVPRLLAGVFGTRAFMARTAGQVSTPRKAAAARQNGAKGGRPRKPVGV